MVASLRWPGLSAALYGSAFTYLVMSSSACSWLNVGTSTSFSPTTSGTEPARMAVASWLVSSLGGVRWSTTFRFLCDALNAATSAFAGPSVAWRAQKCTVPVALSPNVVDEGEESDEPLLHAAAIRATAAATPNVSALFLGNHRISHTSTVRGGCARPQATRLIGLISGPRLRGSRLAGGRGVVPWHPHPHRPAIPVVPLEIGDGGRGDHVTGRRYAVCLHVGEPAVTGRQETHRFGLDTDGIAYARQRPFIGTNLPGNDGEVFEIQPGRLVGLLEAVHERAPLHRHGPAQRVDAPARVGQPRHGSEVA